MKWNGIMIKQYRKQNYYIQVPSHSKVYIPFELKEILKIVSFATQQGIENGLEKEIRQYREVKWWISKD